VIGRHYDRERYNCAHFVADWYAEKLGIKLEVVNEFDMSFVRWMRTHFDKVNRPSENCLVRMQHGRSAHIGVYADNGVYHNLQSGNTNGSVVHWTLGMITRNYTKVTFWKWSG